MPKTNRDRRLPKFSIRKVKFYRRKKAKTKNRRFVCRKKEVLSPVLERKKAAKLTSFCSPICSLFSRKICFSLFQECRSPFFEIFGAKAIPKGFDLSPVTVHTILITGIYSPDSRRYGHS